MGEVETRRKPAQHGRPGRVKVLTQENHSAPLTQATGSSLFKLRHMPCALSIAPSFLSLISPSLPKTALLNICQLYDYFCERRQGLLD
jgi:hypothetical protein